MNSTTATPLPKMGALVSVAAATPSASTPSRSLFTPPPASSTGKGRSADWNAKTDVDLPKFNSLQARLQMPSTVKTITSEDAARKALQPFGPDPEKTAKAQMVKAREGREAAAAPTPALSEAKIPSTIKKKPSTAATAGGFPPMSSAAPTPFSLKSGDGGDKKADAFPPMSLKGPSPSPFGAHAAAKKDDDAPSGLTPKAASGSATKKDSASLTSGNLFGLTRPDSAKKEAEAKPFGGGGGSGLSGFGGALGGALGGTADTASTPSKPAATDAPDYSALLTDFFNQAQSVQGWQRRQSPHQVQGPGREAIPYLGAQVRRRQSLEERCFEHVGGDSFIYHCWWTCLSAPVTLLDINSGE